MRDTIKIELVNIYGQPTAVVYLPAEAERTTAVCDHGNCIIDCAECESVVIA